MAENDEVSLMKLYQDLISSPPGATWSTKLQNYCEIFWTRVEREPIPPPDLVDEFIKLLRNDDNLLLARLVIPDLRIAIEPPDNPIKLKILGHIDPNRSSIRLLGARTQQYDTEEHTHFLEERQLLLEAELYRASLLLYGHSNINEAQKKRLQEWLAAYPAESTVDLPSLR
ncbi:hypothetical protein COCVIDRAFT_103029 [Bipolaris victoriae FI3]|uniref:Uncharacterized protein n=1 Tax=Bipolaris victoriae (strain FI3) TaxID=930091 RepID=W7EFC8_BIPV3|nr:hypothetical protein COCVIDRAFT_103029 [Bipolaris victoriae FI3]